MEMDGSMRGAMDRGYDMNGAEVVGPRARGGRGRGRGRNGMGGGRGGRGTRRKLRTEEEDAILNGLDDGRSQRNKRRKSACPTLA
jgi:hypothetical protein